MTIMDRGLRERRAQIRAQKRAERLKAREGRSRSVRKADPDEDSEIPLSGSGKILGKGAGKSPTSTSGTNNTVSGAISAGKEVGGKDESPILGTTKHRADNSYISRTTDEDNYREALGHTREADTTNSNRQKLLTSIGRTSAFEDSSGKVPEENPIESAESTVDNDTDYVYDHNMTMAENVINMEKQSADKEFKDNLNNGMPLEEAATIYNDRVDAARKRTEGGSVSDGVQDDLNAGIDTNTNTVTDTTSDDAYAKEMEQTKYNIMRDNAGKFLRSFAQAGVDNMDKINTAGWDAAGNMVKAMFTQPHAMSTASRIIGSAMTMTDTIGKMADETSKRFGIAVEADPKLIKDTLRYRAYERAKKDDGHVMGNAMRVMDNTLRSMGVQDITQLDSAQLMDYRDVLTDEMSRLRNLLEADNKVRQGDRSAGLRREMSGMLKDADALIRPGRHSYDNPGWDGRLRGDDRNLLMRTYNVLTDHMKELDKQSSVLSREEKARMAEDRAKVKAEHKKQYETSPFGYAMKIVSPGYGIALDSSGMPRDPRYWSKLENQIARMMDEDRATGNWRRSEAEYRKDLDYIKKARREIFETKNERSIKAYSKSPLGWALEKAFPSYKVPIDPATGIPTDYDKIGFLERTIKTIAQDKPHLRRKCQAALDDLKAHKDNIRSMKARQITASFGADAEYLEGYIPNIGKDLLMAQNTGIWGGSANKAEKLLQDKLTRLGKKLKAEGKDPRQDKEYKATYCMYKSAIFSEKFAKRAGMIAPTLDTQLIRAGINPIHRNRDLEFITRTQRYLRKYFPVSFNEASAVDLDYSDRVATNVDAFLDSLDSKYKAISKSNPTSTKTSKNPVVTPINIQPKSQKEDMDAPNEEGEAHNPDLDAGGESSDDSDKGRVYSSLDDTVKSLMNNSKLRKYSAKLRKGYSNLMNGSEQESAFGEFNSVYDEMFNEISTILDSKNPRWYRHMDEDGKRSSVARILDKIALWDKGNSPGPRYAKIGISFPDKYGTVRFNYGKDYTISTGDYYEGEEALGGTRLWNNSFVNALYVRDSENKWIPKNPYLAAADVLQVSNSLTFHKGRPLTYQEAYDWVVEYQSTLNLEEEVNSDEEHDDDNDEGGKPKIIVGPNGKEQLDETLDVDEEEQEEPSFTDERADEIPNGKFVWNTKESIDVNIKNMRESYPETYNAFMDAIKTNGELKYKGGRLIIRVTPDSIKDIIGYSGSRIGDIFKRLTGEMEKDEINEIIEAISSGNYNVDTPSVIDHLGEFGIGLEKYLKSYGSGKRPLRINNLMGEDLSDEDKYNASLNHAKERIKDATYWNELEPIVRNYLDAVRSFQELRNNRYTAAKGFGVPDAVNQQITLRYEDGNPIQDSNGKDVYEEVPYVRPEQIPTSEKEIKDYIDSNVKAYMDAYSKGGNYDEKLKKLLIDHYSNRARALATGVMTPEEYSKGFTSKHLYESMGDLAKNNVSVPNWEALASKRYMDNRDFEKKRAAEEAEKALNIRQDELGFNHAVRTLIKQITGLDDEGLENNTAARKLIYEFDPKEYRGVPAIFIGDRYVGQYLPASIKNFGREDEVVDYYDVSNKNIANRIKGSILYPILGAKWANMSKDDKAKLAWGRGLRPFIENLKVLNLGKDEKFGFTNDDLDKIRNSELMKLMVALYELSPPVKETSEKRGRKVKSKEKGAEDTQPPLDERPEFTDENLDAYVQKVMDVAEPALQYINKPDEIQNHIGPLVDKYEMEISDRFKGVSFPDLKNKIMKKIEELKSNQPSP
jgi:hypothetical protein